MPIWGWIAIAAGGWLLASVVVALFLTRMFALFSAPRDDGSAGSEFEAWAAKPPTRAAAPEEAGSAQSKEPERPAVPPSRRRSS
jgi:hypothetical protein